MYVSARDCISYRKNKIRINHGKHENLETLRSLLPPTLKVLKLQSQMEGPSRNISWNSMQIHKEHER